MEIAYAGRVNCHMLGTNIIYKSILLQFLHCASLQYYRGSQYKQMANVISQSQHFCLLNFHPDCTLAHLAAWCGIMSVGLPDGTV